MIAKSILYGVFLIPVQTAITLAFNFFLIDKLDPKSLSEWYLLLSVLPLFSVLEFGFPSLMVRYLSGSNDVFADSIRVIKKSMLLMALATTIVSVVLCVVHENFLMAFIFSLSSYFRMVANVVASCVFSAGFVFHDRIYKFSYAVLMPLIGFVVCVSGGMLFGVILAWFISSIVCLLVAFGMFKICIKKTSGVFPMSQEIPLSANMKIIAYSIPSLFIFSLPIYYLGLFGASDDVVAFGLTLQILNVFYMFSTLLTSVFYPSISRSFANRSVADARNIFSFVLKISFFSAVLASVFLMYFGTDLLFFIDGKVSVWDVVVGASLLIIIEGVQVAVTGVGISIGFYRFYVQSTFSALLIALLVCFFGASFWTLIYSIALSQILTSIPFNLYFVSKYLSYSVVSTFVTFLMSALIPVIFYCVKTKYLFVNSLIFALLFIVAVGVIFKFYVNMSGSFARRI